MICQGSKKGEHSYMKQAVTKVFWQPFKHAMFRDRTLYVAATENGLCKLTWPHESMEDLSGWAHKNFPQAELVADEARMNGYVQQLEAYLDGKLTRFTLPIDFRGTEFQVSVWQALTQIPFGQTRSYSEIAEAIGKPSAVRAVGAANGANPVPIVVPCHRVIGKNAALTGFRGGLQTKEELLRLEGVYHYARQGHARFQF